MRRHNHWARPVRHDDSYRLPYGDLFGNDEAMENYLDIRNKMYEIGKARRELAKGRKMSRRKFKEWKAHLFDIDDDKPLREYLE